MRIFVFFIFMLLSGCISAPHLSDFLLPDYTLGRDLTIQVYRIDFNSSIPYNRRFPHIENKVPVSPEQALKDFIQQRIHTYQTHPYRLVVSIEQADLLQEKDPKPHWYQQDNIKFTLSYFIRLQFYQGNIFLSEKTIGGFEMRSIPKLSSLNKKEETWLDMMKCMLKKTNQQIEEHYSK